MTVIIKNRAMAPERIYREAIAAGDAAFAAAIPETMYVVDDFSDRTWVVPDGPCGFAWVTIRPARGKLVSWLKGQGIGRNGYQGGWQVWGGDCGGDRASQSFTRKMAAASAFAEVLRSYGINATADGRLD